MMLDQKNRVDVSMRRQKLMLGLGLVGLMMGCNDAGLCVEGIELGKTYEVTVVEEYNKSSTFKFDDEHFYIQDSLVCGHFDLKVGATFTMKPTKQLKDLACDGRAATVSGVTLPTLGKTLRPVQSGSRGIMTSPTLSAELPGGCSMQWEVHLDSPDRDADPLGPLIPGEYPPAVLMRRLVPDPATTEACVASGMPAGRDRCIDYFVVQLRKSE